MRILQLDIDLHGNRDITINGVRMENGHVLLDETVIRKQLTLDQQFFILCELKKTLSLVEHIYSATKVNRGEMTEKDFDERFKRKKAH